MKLLSPNLTPTFIEQTGIYSTLRSEFVITRLGSQVVGEATAITQNRAQSLRGVADEDFDRHLRQSIVEPTTFPATAEDYAIVANVAFDLEAARRFGSIGSYTLGHVSRNHLSLAHLSTDDEPGHMLCADLTPTKDVVVYMLPRGISSVRLVPSFDVSYSDVATMESGLDNLGWVNTQLQNADLSNIDIEAVAPKLPPMIA